MSLASGNGRPVLGPKPHEAAAASENGPSTSSLRCVVILICLQGRRVGDDAAAQPASQTFAVSGHVPRYKPDYRQSGLRSYVDWLMLRRMANQTVISTYRVR